MPYSRIKSSRSLKSSLQYVEGHGHGHNGHKERNLVITGINLVPGISYYSQMADLLQKASAQNQTQCRSTIISFGRNELDPRDPDAAYTAAEIGREVAKQMWPEHPSAIYVQCDGKSGLLHLHIITGNVSVIDHKGLVKQQTWHPYLRKTVDDVCSQYFDLAQPVKTSEKVSQSVRTLRQKQDAYIWQDDLKTRIQSAADVSSSYDDFKENLPLYGVRITREGKPSKRHPDGYITYELTDSSGFSSTQKKPKNLRSKSYKLGTTYEKPALEKIFAANASLLLPLDDYSYEDEDELYEDLIDMDADGIDDRIESAVSIQQNLRSAVQRDIEEMDLELYLTHEEKASSHVAKYLLSVQQAESEREKQRKEKEADRELGF